MLVQVLHWRWWPSSSARDQSRSGVLIHMRTATAAHFQRTRTPSGAMTTRTLRGQRAVVPSHPYPTPSYAASHHSCSLAGYCPAAAATTAAAHAVANITWHATSSHSYSTTHRHPTAPTAFATNRWCTRAHAAVHGCRMWALGTSAAATPSAAAMLQNIWRPPVVRKVLLLRWRSATVGMHHGPLRTASLVVRKPGAIWTHPVQWRATGANATLHHRVSTSSSTAHGPCSSDGATDPGLHHWTTRAVRQRSGTAALHSDPVLWEIPAKKGGGDGREKQKLEP